MNAGFSNLTYLKKKLLLADDAAGSVYDDAVAALGISVVGMFESLTDRFFERMAGDKYEAPGDRAYVVLPRYPIEAITGFEIRENLTEGWVAQDLPDNFNSSAGLVQFFAPRGVSPAMLRVTYTGGYWWDTTEDDSGSMPAGATAIPQGLVLAWVLACRFFWDRQSIEDRAKAGFRSEEIERFLVSSSKLPELVTITLEKFRRYA